MLQSCHRITFGYMLFAIIRAPAAYNSSPSWRVRHSVVADRLSLQFSTFFHRLLSPGPPICHHHLHRGRTTSRLFPWLTRLHRHTIRLRHQSHTRLIHIPGRLAQPRRSLAVSQLIAARRPQRSLGGKILHMAVAEFRAVWRPRSVMGWGPGWWLGLPFPTCINRALH